MSKTPPSIALKGNKKTMNAWAFYDWANSVYNLVIGTAIFPIFFSAMTSEKNEAGEIINDQVSFFGWQLTNTTLYSYTLAASFLVVIILSPILSGIADYGGKKKTFLSLFCYIGSIACMTLFWFDPEHLEISMLSVFLASLGFWNSLVFYNAYLPEIAEEKDHDRLSARGFAMGYIGSVVLLIINLAMMMVWDIPAQWCFITVGIWWLAFAQVTLRRLPANPYKKKPEGNVLTYGFDELRKVYRQVKKTKRLKSYLWAFLIFSMAVQTIMLMAQFFADKEVSGIGQTELIVSILILQIIAVPGALLFSKLSGMIGNIKTLAIALVIWIGVCIFAFYVVYEPFEFYIAAGIIGLLMGGTQSLSRSTYSKFLPETKDHASFFSFYDVAEKVGIVVGMISFGYIEDITGSIRNSILALVTFFVIGLVLLFFVPKEETPLSLTKD